MFTRTQKHRSKSFFRLSLSLFIGLAFACPSISELRAQTLSCSGSACPAEILNNIDSLGNLLEINYGRRLADSFSSAHAISNVALIPHIADVSLGIFTLGVELSASFNKNDIESEGNTGASSIENPDFKGIYAQGLTYGGLNLGILSTFLGWGSNILDPIDLYYGQIKSEINASLGQDFDSLEYNFDTLYLGLRYQLIGSLGIFVAGWQGLSLHLGRIVSKTNIEIEDDDKSPTERFSIAGFNWQATNEIKFKSEAETTVMELNTGFQLLFIYLSLGAGAAYHYTETSFSFRRSGNLYDSDTELDAVLNAEFGNRYGLEAYRMYYMKMGLEFGLVPFTRIGLEAVYNSKNLYSISLGTRINI